MRTEHASVLAFPSPLSEPPLQPTRRGRLPRGVVSLRAYRQQQATEAATEAAIVAQVRQQALAYTQQAARLIAAAGALEEWLEARR